MDDREGFWHITILTNTGSEATVVIRWVSTSDHDSTCYRSGTRRKGLRSARLRDAKTKFCEEFSNNIITEGNRSIGSDSETKWIWFRSSRIHTATASECRTKLAIRGHLIRESGSLVSVDAATSIDSIEIYIFWLNGFHTWVWERRWDIYARARTIETLNSIGTCWEFRMKYLCCVCKNIWDKWGISTSLFREFVSEVCFGDSTISGTSDVWLVIVCLDLSWGLSIGTCFTSLRRCIPFLWRDTTCTWETIGEIIITTDGLEAAYDTTLIFVVRITIDTVSTLTALVATTDSVIDTYCRITSSATWETFLLSSTIELTFPTSRWDTRICDRIPGRSCRTTRSYLHLTAGRTCLTIETSWETEWKSDIFVCRWILGTVELLTAWNSAFILVIVWNTNSTVTTVTWFIRITDIISITGDRTTWLARWFTSIFSRTIILTFCTAISNTGVDWRGDNCWWGNTSIITSTGDDSTCTYTTSSCTLWTGQKSCKLIRSSKSRISNCRNMRNSRRNTETKWDKWWDSFGRCIMCGSWCQSTITCQMLIAGEFKWGTYSRSCSRSSYEETYWTLWSWSLRLTRRTDESTRFTIISRTGTIRVSICTSEVYLPVAIVIDTVATLSHSIWCFSIISSARTVWVRCTGWRRTRSPRSTNCRWKYFNSHLTRVVAVIAIISTIIWIHLRIIIETNIYFLCSWRCNNAIIIYVAELSDFQCSIISIGKTYRSIVTCSLITRPFTNRNWKFIIWNWYQFYRVSWIRTSWYNCWSFCLATWCHLFKRSLCCSKCSWLTPLALSWNVGRSAPCSWTSKIYLSITIVVDTITTLRSSWNCRWCTSGRIGTTIRTSTGSCRIYSSTRRRSCLYASYIITFICDTTEVPASSVNSVCSSRTKRTLCTIESLISAIACEETFIYEIIWCSTTDALGTFLRHTLELNTPYISIVSCCIRPRPIELPIETSSLKLISPSVTTIKWLIFTNNNICPITPRGSTTNNLYIISDSLTEFIITRWTPSAKYWRRIPSHIVLFDSLSPCLSITEYFTR